MGLLIQDTSTELLLVLTTFILLIVSYFYNSYNYWAKKGVPTIKPTFPLGNSNSFNPQGLSIGTLSKKFYDKFKSQGYKFGGVYLVTAPNLVIVDPDLIKDIISKDFQYFVDRGFYYNKEDDPISAHLFALDGLDWKNLRVKLTPTFTSGKMKMMFHAVTDCCDNMIKAVGDNLHEDIDIKEMLSRFTTDVIGTCAFGIQCNSCTDPNAEFRGMGRAMFAFDRWKAMRNFFIVNLPKLALKLRIKAVRELTTDFIYSVVRDTLTMRKKHNIRRNDFLQLLIDMKESGTFTIDEVAAQVLLFFIAGFETSSTAMTFALYELAKHQNIQEKLREEVCSVLEKYNGKFTYESLNNMKYLEQVFNETLRMYPPLPTLNRRCAKNYTIPDTDVVIEEGTYVLISALGLHMDPEFFPEPENFDPERFSEEKKKNRHPFTHLPFGDGPRNCIGLRFGQMQSKIGIAAMVKNFYLSLSPATGKLVFNPYSFFLQTKNQLYLRAEKVK